MINRKIYLTSVDDVKAEGLINYNCDDGIIAECIRKSQTMYLREIIGDNLLERVQELIETGDIDKPQYEKYLVLLNDYIAPYLAFQTAVQATWKITYKIRNIGTTQDNDTNINSLTRSDLIEIANDLNTEAVDAQNRMIDFILEVGFEEIQTVCACGKKRANLKKQANTCLYMD